MSDWQDTTLGAICESGGGRIQTGPFGSQLHASDYVESGIPSVMPQNIGDNYVIEDGIARITEDDAIRLAKYRLKTNDIVYSRRGDVERRALIRPANNGWLCGTGCLKVTFGDNPQADPAFVAYQLGTEESRAWIVRHAVGATMLNLNTTILSNVPLRMPSLAVQRSIAEILGALDEKIAANTKLVETLDASFIAHWKELVSSATAETATVSSLLGALIGGDWGTSEATESSQDAVYCIRGADIADLQQSGLGKMPRRFVKPSSLKRRRLEDGDLVVEMSGGSPTQSTGRAVLVTDALLERLDLPLSSSNFCKIIRPADPENAFYLYGLLRDSWQKGEFFPFENGSTGIKNLAFSDYSSTKVVSLPSAEKLRSFNMLARSLVEGMQSVGVESTRLAVTRDVLLPRLMSGELHVREAEEIMAAAI